MCEPIIMTLMMRDGLSERAAREELESLRERVREGENPIELLEDELGLEPDYIFDLI